MNAFVNAVNQVKSNLCEYINVKPSDTAELVKRCLLAVSLLNPLPLYEASMVCFSIAEVRFD